MSTGIENFDVQEFIDAFRQSLATPDPAQEQKLIEMMTTYGRLCEDANRRLRECTGLSVKGLYANAVALAEREPNLMDRCSALEIPERDILSTVASALGINAPSLLNRDLVEALQETYEKGTTAESNVRILHRLTLARAPLPTRLAIMRRLQVQDPNRPFIDADIRSFERSWFKRVNDFAQPFAKAGNVETLEEILNDLQTSGYLETPPQQVISSLQGHIAKARTLQLPILAQEIQAAHKSGAHDVLKQLAVRWKQLVAKSGISDAASRYQVTEALNWVNRKLAEEARIAERTQARNRLSEVLANSKSQREEVDAAWQSAKLLEATDEYLESNYQNWFRARNRRKVLLASGGGIVAVVFLIFAGIAYLQWSHQQAFAAEVAVAISKIEQHLKDKNYKKALAVGENVSLAVAEHPEVAKLLKTVAEGEKLVAAFETGLQNLKSPNLPEDSEKLEKDLRALAGDDPELNQKIDETVAETKRNKEKQRDAGRSDFDKQLTALDTSVEELLETTKRGDFAPQHVKLYKDYGPRITELRDTAKTNGFDSMVVDDLEKKLEQVAPWADTTAKLEKFSADISTDRVSPDTLRRIADFLTSTVAKIHPDEKAKQRAKAAKEDSVVWQNTLKLSGLIEAGKVDAQVRKQWLGKPPMSALDSALAPADMLRQRDFTATDSEAYKLKERLLAPDIKDVYAIRIELAEPYCYWYTKEILDAGADPVDWKVITDSKGGVLTQKIRGKRKQAELSPQSKLLADLEKLWTGKPAADKWHEQLAEAYDRLAEDSDIEPLLKLQLMRKFLSLAAASSIGYRQILDSMPNYKSIRGTDAIVDGNWYVATNILSEERTKATAICDKAPRLGKIAADAAARDQSESGKNKGGVNLVGVLQQEASGETTLALFASVNPTNDSRLYVVSEGAWLAIGSLKADKKSKLEESAKQFVGWPVFSIRSAGSAP